jgi:hypothetical protein
LARNLGLDFAKYDIWIQRLAVALYGSGDMVGRIDNSKMDSGVRALCDRLFEDTRLHTGEKIGFIDVVLWRSCQKGILKIEKGVVFLGGV